jgi:hypothetical protein
VSGDEPAEPSSPAGVAPGGGLLRTTVALVAAQGFLLVAIAGFYVVEMVVATASTLLGAALSALLALLAGVALLAVARGLHRGRRWARSPALLTQLLLVPVAVELLAGPGWYVGGPLLAWALAVAVLLFLPGVARHLRD